MKSVLNVVWVLELIFFVVVVMYLYIHWSNAIDAGVTGDSLMEARERAHNYKLLLKLGLGVGGGLVFGAVMLITGLVLGQFIDFEEEEASERLYSNPRKSQDLRRQPDRPQTPGVLRPRVPPTLKGTCQP